MHPVTFDNCFGLFSPGWSRKGVVICNSFGLEHIRYKPALAQLSATLSARGLNVLWFDYYGTGDSAGTSLDPDVLVRWKQNTLAACDWLSTQSHVDELSLMGLRLGAMIAAQACTETASVKDLVLLAPPASGKSFVAELLHAAQSVPGDANDCDGRSGLPFDGVDIAGYRLCGQTMTELEAFRWDTLAGCWADNVTILANSRSDDSQALSSVFSGLGCNVDLKDTLAGFDRSMSDLRASQRDAPLWSEAADLIDVPKDARAALPPVTPFIPMAGPGYLETPIFLDSAPEYAGIFCQASNGSEGRTAVIVMPSADGHALSWPRLPVELSRRLARAGIACLRLRAPKPKSTPALQDANPGQNSTGNNLSAAIDWLKARHYSYVTLIAGTEAEQVELETASLDTRISEMILIDKPPLPLGMGGQYVDIRESDKATIRANPDSRASQIPESRRAIRKSRESLQCIKDLSFDRDHKPEPLEARLESYASSARPLAIMHCESAKLSPALANFDSWAKRDVAAAGQPKKLDLQILTTEGPNLASDTARNTAGEFVLNFLNDQRAENTKGYRLALRPV